ncbi:PsiF family protein [Belnapia rosea]|uniref:PsiF repeat-containing protein n=1 Tax=Belnapia rosea TaxID=938405 RepID=A0A1G6LM11_9PROT|nr:PsiF family protein [Belnapia rosea]SDB47107.1 psiF repeat-containing protein [Belnapia rosea]SDC44241.1 psiF repeat-containing protein [Belnapia rosea]
MRPVILVLSLLLAPSLADAAERRAPSEAQRAQQAKMRSCASQASGQQLRGAPRREFMKTCLSGRATG